MVLYEAAQWRPLATGDPGVLMDAHDVVCLHTMVGFLAGTETMFRKDGWGGTESHFGVGGPADGPLNDGVIYQWVDTDFQADANLQGNPRLISIETSDGGDERNEWSSAQLDAITGIIVWCCREYSIPADLITDSSPEQRGIGYHRQGIDPWRVPNGEKWSNAQGKVCPGDIRIGQLIHDIIPRVQQQLSDSSLSAVVQLASVNPSAGPSGVQVVLSGAGFERATGVSFGDVWAENWSIDDDTQITATVPEPLTSGSVWVTVASPDATSEAVLFAYDENSIPSLSLESLTPDAASSGEQVVLSGVGFEEATGVSFGDVWVETWSVDDDTQITATVPEPMTSGSVWVTVVSAEATSEALLFAYQE